MSDKRKAAITIESIAEKKLSEISAADFLEALDTRGVTSIAGIRVWPEKKKLEYLLEPENLGGVRLGDLLRGVFAEKKKLELEKANPAEMVHDPRVLIRDPEFIKELAVAVAKQIKG